MMFKLQKNKKGFTLIELLVVIAILGILAAIVLPQMIGQTDKGKVGQIKADLATMDSAIQLYNNEQGANPTTIDSMVPSYLIAAPQGVDTTKPFTPKNGTSEMFVSYGISGNRAIGTFAPGGALNVNDLSTW